MRRSNDPRREDGLEHVEPVRQYEYRDPERFDRIAYARHALDVLAPPKLTVALYSANLHLHVERGNDHRAGPPAEWAILGIPPHASRRQIAVAVVDLAGLAGTPYIVDLLVASAAPSPV
jgi:hypothetical protein